MKIMNAAVPPSDEPEIDLWASYTLQQAAVQTLCWMHGKTRQKYHLGDSDFNQLNQHSCLDGLRGDFTPILDIFLRAKAALIDGQRYGHSVEALQNLDDEFNYYGNLFDKYFSYLLDIDAEVVNMSCSFDCTQDAQEDIKVSRFSLHTWVCSKYGVRLIGSPPPSLITLATGTTEKGVTRKAPETSTTPKPRQKLGDQTTAILNQIISLGYHANALPKNEQGKSGVKSEVKKALANTELFSGTTVFDKAWERLRKRGDIRDSP